MVVGARGAAAALATALAAGCAPDAADREVRLEALSPQARADRDAALTGRDSAAPPSAGAAPGARAAAEVPDRPAGARPNIVDFALATDHPVGTQVYDRAAPSAERAAEVCERYGDDNLAQRAFLKAGGPEDDPRGMDPDGDGYVCGWDPARFRRAVR